VNPIDNQIKCLTVWLSLLLGLSLFSTPVAGVGAFTNTNPMTTARTAHTATLLPNGKVLVAAGFAYTDTYLSSAELYDPSTGTWTVTGALSKVRRWHTATLLPNGEVLVAAGFNSNAELYDPATGTWTATGALSTNRHYHTATLLPNGKVLVVGGWGCPVFLYTLGGAWVEV
jgi:WD40 repeat protein